MQNPRSSQRLFFGTPQLTLDRSLLSTHISVVWSLPQWGILGCPIGVEPIPTLSQRVMQKAATL